MRLQGDRMPETGDGGDDDDGTTIDVFVEVRDVKPITLKPVNSPQLPEDRDQELPKELPKPLP